VTATILSNLETSSALSPKRRLKSFLIKFTLFASTVLSSSTAAFSDCVTTASAVTCTGTPDGFNNSGSWALGLQGQPKTLINDGTLNPDDGATGIVLYGNGWSITNNDSILKDSGIGAVLFTAGSTTQTKSVFDNKSSGTVVSSNTVGSIVTGYLYSRPTYNLKINNSGSIYQSTASNVVTHPGAIYIGGDSFNIAIVNKETGTIVGGDGSSGFHSAISNHGKIDKIENYGLIQGVGPSAAAIYSEDIIKLLGNSGTIQAVGSVAPTAISLNNSTVTDLQNNGLIEASGSSGAKGISMIGAHVSNLRNFGQIIGANSGIDLDSSSTLTRLLNTGTIRGTSISGSGIKNSGTIGTLVNAQSGLSYSGVLPTNYSVFISSPTQFGQLAVTSPSGVTNFSIYQTSKIAQNTTYLNVMSGVTAANFTGGVAPSGRFGTGAMVTQIPWYMQNTGSNWDLITQLSPVQSTDPTIPGSSSGTSLAQAISNAGVAASTAVPTPSNPVVDPVLSNGTTLSAAVQNITTPEVDALINTHAEGYSSNMTILMERMAGISNATMDRIHSPNGNISANSSTDRVPAKHLWGDVTAYRGTVDSYDNLAGFDYDVLDFMAGADFYRGNTVSMGVFGGGGTSRMTESAQVQQSYDSTNFYGGLYGAAFLPSNFKLSGSAGYMFSSTDAQRDIPDVGDFTGGTAEDTYSSNGVFGSLKLSRPIAVGASAVVTPFIAQSYSQLWVGDVNEDGGGDFNFSIDSSTAYSTVSFVGIDAVIALTDDEVDPLSFVGSVRYGYDWLANDDSSHEVTASSPIFGDFVQVGANMGPNSLQLGAGLQGGLSDKVSLRAGVVGDLNSHGYEIGAGGRLRVEF
jgi:uncharacterized protein with beta-barrel porin domain